MIEPTLPFSIGKGIMETMIEEHNEGPKVSPQHTPPEAFQGVVQTVFRDFVERLQQSKEIEPVVIERVRQVLLEKGNLSVEALRSALFPDEDLT